MKNKIKSIVVILLIIVSLLFTSNVYASFAEMDDVTSDKQRNEQLQEQEKQDKENFGKSSNNYLKSLSIKGLELTPKFDKQTIDYTVEEVIEVDSIEINADLDDSRAKINGSGIIKLQPGENDIRIDVTAENGIVRTYNIKVKRKGETTVTENKEESTETNIVDENTIDTSATPIQSTNNAKTFITVIMVVVILVILYLLANRSKKSKRRKH